MRVSSTIVMNQSILASPPQDTETLIASVMTHVLVRCEDDCGVFFLEIYAGGDSLGI